jgi:hypothetical protein
MKNKFLYIGIILIVTLLAVLVGCTANNDGKATYVRDYITSQTPTNLTGPIYGTGSAMAGVNIAGVVYSNNGSAPSAATNSQIATALSGATVSALTITTATFPNHAVGTVSFTGGTTTKVVTHGMSGTPAFIFFSVEGGAMGTASSATAANSLFWTSSNATSFTINAGVSTNTTRTVDWLAFIADE